GYMGEIWRQDKHTNRESNVAVWLDNYDGWAAKDVPYRFAWTFPLFFSQHDSTTLYTAAQYLFKSTNGGQSWTKISPDLSRADPRTLQRSGGPIHGDMTGTEWYAMAFAVAESPLQKGLIWAGSDDGLVHLTRDGGATWDDVTPKGLGPFTKMNIVEPGRFDAGTAYIAANRYQQDDFAPYLLKTHDYGRTWTRIDAGIPMGAYARVIREDPVRRGLLYAGTETGVYVSFDDGAHWQSLQLNLPRVSVRDLAVKGNDLIAATHGRAFWILDDVTPLRQVNDEVRSASAHLFAPATAIRFQADRSRPSLTSGQNPFNGVYVDYWFTQKPTGQVKLEFSDASGKVIRTFTSDEEGETPKRDTTRIAYTASDSLKAFTAYDTTGQSSQRKRIEGDSASYEPADSVVQARAGLNRFVWNLRANGVREIKDIVNDEGVTDGPMVVPGTYTVRLTANGRTLSQPFSVVDDPRVHATPAELAASYDLATKTVAKINDITDAVERIGKLQSQLSATSSLAKGAPYAKRVDSAATSLKGRLEAIRAQLADVHSEADQITLHYPVRPYNQLLNVNRMAQSFERGPTEQSVKVLDSLAAQVDALIARERQLESQDIQAFNAMLREVNMPAVPVKLDKPIS
ncbi:MAG TPA: hypothetical protein VFP15_12670, partial [Gemmatimonadaceae bacterium]|nr:hypothetical protein [Gemmatimonadaceae bacterium]